MNHVGLHPSRPRNGLSLCAGYGGLDLGLQLAEPGFHTRCFVEVDPDAQAALVAGMVGGYLPGLAKHGAGPAGPGYTASTQRRARPFRPAPVWNDMRTFVGHGWRGHIDAILAGYPCQPFSAAGQRRGADDERHLWPDVARIAREVDPEWLFLENVAGHVSLGLETVLRDIWHMGFTPAAGLFSAGETGAPHERLRVFIVAHRPRQRAGEPHDAQRAQPRERAWDAAGRGCRRSDGELAHANGGHACPERQQRGGELGFQPEGRGYGAEPVGHASRIGRREGRPEPEVRRGRDAAARAGGAMDHAQQHGRTPGRDRDHGWDERQQPDAEGRAMADAKRDAGHQGRHRAGGPENCFGQAGGAGASRTSLADPGQPGLSHPEQRASGGSPGDKRWRTASERGRPCLHPPGPAEAERWADILGTSPYLAPAASLRDCLAWAGDLAAALEGPGGAAAQSALCLLASGLAVRARALRGLGNGVHPLTAAYAWRSLAQAHGLNALELQP